MRIKEIKTAAPEQQAGVNTTGRHRLDHPSCHCRWMAGASTRFVLESRAAHSFGSFGSFGSGALAGLAAGALVLAPVGSRASLNFQESREKCPALGSTSNCLFVGPPAAARVQLQHAGRHAPSCATHPCHMHYMRCWSAGAHLPADNMRHSSQRMQLHC